MITGQIAYVFEPHSILTQRAHAPTVCV